MHPPFEFVLIARNELISSLSSPKLLTAVHVTLSELEISFENHSFASCVRRAGRTAVVTMSLPFPRS